MKVPHFPFYPNDWLSDPKVMLMTPAEEGAYIRLVAINWQDGGLPMDDESLAGLSRLGKAWAKSKNRILSCFVENDGKLWNKRLLKELEKYEKFRDKQSENGKRGGRPKKVENEPVDTENQKGLGFSGLSETKAKKSLSLSLSHSLSLSEENTGGDKPLPASVLGESTDKALVESYAQLQPKDKTNVYHFIRKHRPQFIEPYYDLWNMFATEKGFARATVLGNSRRKKFRIRIREEPFDFTEILRKAGASDYLMGEGRWFTFDWILENSTNYVKVLEGNYDNKTKETTNEQNEEYQKRREMVRERTRQRAEE